MGRVLAIIGGLLVVVIIVAFAVTLYEDSVREEKKAAAVMFHLAPAQVDRITIDGPDGAQARLVRANSRWILPDLNGFPADADRVETLLHRLLAIDREQPARSGVEGFAELKLADDDFERRITLARGGKNLASVLIGKARGPRHVYLRRAGEETAYTVIFGLFDAMPQAAEWIDHGALKLARGDITMIEVDGLSMTAVPDDTSARWQLPDAATTEELNPAAVDHLAELLANLEIDALLSEAETPEAGEPLLELSLTARDGTVIDYSLQHSPAANVFSIWVSSRPETFRLSPYSAKQLLNAARRDALFAPADGVSHHAVSGATGQALPVHN